MQKIISDGELGIITLRTHPRATRYTLKVVSGRLVGVMPERGSEELMMKLIADNRERLRLLLQKHRCALLNEETELQTFSFRLRILRHGLKGYRMWLKEGYLCIACPEEVVFDDSLTQQTLRRMLEAALRHEAKRLLPPRLEMLAARHGFRYKRVGIHNTKSCWGSCTSSRSINLSLSLMLLPEHLIDYVLLHELCHTVEMSHDELFWKMMNHVTDGKALLLRKELKNYRPL